MSIHIDMKAVNSLQVRGAAFLVLFNAVADLARSRSQLEVTLESIRESIIKAPKLKIKGGVRSTSPVLSTCATDRSSSSLAGRDRHSSSRPDPRLRPPRRRYGRVGLPPHPLAPSRASWYLCQGSSAALLAHRTQADPLLASQGVPGLQRAVIQANASGKKELLVEGEGLREVMTTDGELTSWSRAQSPTSLLTRLRAQVSSARKPRPTTSWRSRRFLVSRPLALASSARLITP